MAGVRARDLDQTAFAASQRLGGKLAVWMVIFQCLVAWGVAFLAYQLTSIL